MAFKPERLRCTVLMQTTVPEVVLMITTNIGGFDMNGQIWVVEFDQFDAHVNAVNGPFPDLEEVFKFAAKRRQEIAEIAAGEWAS